MSRARGFEAGLLACRLPKDLHVALKEYIADQRVKPRPAQVTIQALKDFLEGEGYYRKPTNGDSQ